MTYNMKNPYPKMGASGANRKGVINKNFESNTNLKDGKSKSSVLQKKVSAVKNYKEGYYPA